MQSNTMTFFGLTQPVFVRPPKKPYMEPPRTTAFNHLKHLVQRRGFAVLTGPSGSGKTALLHYLCNSLSENHYQITYVPFAFLEKTHMLQYISNKMALQPERGIAATIRTIQNHLHDIQPINPVIVIDEVERLELHTTHIIRLLANDRADTVNHCTLILAGTDSFVEQTLRLRVNEPLRQRITLYVAVQPLNPQHTREYIAHCLNAAGAASDLFQPPALQLIDELANGIIRTINTLAEAAMDQAAQDHQNTIQLEHVQQAAKTALPQPIIQATP